MYCNFKHHIKCINSEKRHLSITLSLLHKVYLFKKHTKGAAALKSRLLQHLLWKQLRSLSGAILHNNNCLSLKIRKYLNIVLTKEKSQNQSTTNKNIALPLNPWLRMGCIGNIAFSCSGQLNKWPLSNWTHFYFKVFRALHGCRTHMRPF